MIGGGHRAMRMMKGQRGDRSGNCRVLEVSPCVAPDIVDQSLMEWQERVAGRIDAAGNDPARPCNKMSGACPMMST